MPVPNYSARTAGLEGALQVARIHLIDWHHLFQQPYAVLTCRAQNEDAVIARCQQWFSDHYDHHHPVQTMTRISGLAEGSFKRRFRRATGMKPIEYVQTRRLEEAKYWLEAGECSGEAVAGAVGYEDGSFFNRLFRRRVELTPVQYRKRFGALRRVLVEEEQTGKGVRTANGVHSRPQRACNTLRGGLQNSAEGPLYTGRRSATALRKPYMSTIRSESGSAVLPRRSPVMMPSSTVRTSASLSRAA